MMRLLPVLAFGQLASIAEFFGSLIAVAIKIAVVLIMIGVALVPVIIAMSGWKSAKIAMKNEEAARKKTTEQEESDKPKG